MERVAACFLGFAVACLCFMGSGCWGKSEADFEGWLIQEHGNLRSENNRLHGQVLVLETSRDAERQRADKIAAELATLRRELDAEDKARGWERIPAPRVPFPTGKN